MVFHIISAVPELLDSPFQHSIMRRAQAEQLINIQVHDLREYGQGKHNQIDDYQFGGGAGMVMLIQPIQDCINKIKENHPDSKVIYLSPDGASFNQQTANKLSLSTSLIIICGHYKGVDQRVRDHLVDLEISIGDYVLSGGELAAAVLVDSIARLIPGVMNDASSALTDSFQDGLLAAPVYTRPASFQGWEVPEILLSGNDKKIAEWREQKALENTQKNRPDLLKN